VLAYAAIAFERLERGRFFHRFGEQRRASHSAGWSSQADDSSSPVEAMALLAARHHITVSVESQRREEVNYSITSPRSSPSSPRRSSEHPRPGGLLPHGGDGRFAGRHEAARGSG
jgi:hypothetical protein